MARAAAHLVIDIAKDFVPFSSTLDQIQASAKTKHRKESVNNIVGEISERQSLLSYIEKLFSRIADDIDYVLIDDFNHADIDSVKIVFSLLSQFRNGKVRLVFSSANSNRAFQDLYKDFYWHADQTITMHRLTAEECLKVCQELNENLSEKIAHALHQKSEGNFGRLTEFIPQSEADLKDIVQEVASINEDTQLQELMLDDDFASPDWRELRSLFALQIYLDGQVDIELLKCIPEISHHFDNWLKDPATLAESVVAAPIGRNRVALIQHTLVFSTVFQERIKQDFGLRGDLRKISANLAAAILDRGGKSNILEERPRVLFQFFLQFSSEKFLPILESACDKIDYNALPYESILQFASISEEGFRRDLPNFKILISNLFDYCYERSLFDAAARLIPLSCAAGLPFPTTLKMADCARETGLLRRLPEQDFKNFETSLRMQARSLDERIAVANTLCPIYEHRGEYRKIRAEYKLLDADPEIMNNLNTGKIRYHLNRGLNEFHGDILSRLEELRHEIKALPDVQERKVLLAIFFNHVGLCYFYTGFYEESIANFKECLSLTEELGRRIETPTNNLAAAYFMSGALDKAREILETALRIALMPLYQKCTIVLNASLTAFELGLHDKAVEMMEPYVSGEIYLPDPSLDNKFSVNRAYIHFRKQEWEQANRLYMKAVDTEYRFGGDQLRITYAKMARFCAVKAGYISSADLGNMDFLFKEIHEDTVFDKPFSTDVNSLYVF